MSKRVLISFAHPDDETFGLGGFIAKSVAEGVEVSLICATNGDVGTVAPEMLNGYNSIAELRLAELQRAVDMLKITRVFAFGYRDSGMMNSETSRHPSSLWQAPQDEVTRRVVEVIRDVRPHVVITFNEYGGYGHPDHIAIQRATVQAFKLAGDASYETGQPLYAPQKLYYPSLPRRMMRFFIIQIRMKGQDPRQMGKNKDLDMLKVLENAQAPTTLVNIGDYLEVWDRANQCHASQLGGGFPRAPMRVRKIIQNQQGFTRIVPAGRGRVDERDLFQGVKVDD